MKVIDLLNKIANGEEVPKRIEYDNKLYTYVEMWEQYVDKEEKPLLRYISEFNYSGLNDEVNIVEENQKIDIDSIEEIDLFDNGQGFENMKVVKEAYDSNFGHITDTINSLIKAVKQLNKMIKEKE